MIKAVEIENVKGFTLRGFLHLPEGAKEIVVMLHGFTGNKTEHGGHFRNLSRRLEKMNIASIRMDYHGNGESDGEFSDFVFEDAMDDGRRIINYASKIEGIEKVHLLGFSMGGAISSLIVDDKINKLVLWSPAGGMNTIATRVVKGWRPLDNGNYFIPGFEISTKFIDSINKFTMYQNCANINNETLIVQGSKDITVTPDLAERYNREIKNSKLVFVEGAGHGYDAYEQKEELYKLTLDFFK